MNRPGPGGVAQSGWLAPSQQLTVRLVRPNGEFGTLDAELQAVLGRLAYGRPVGLLLVNGSGEVEGIAGVLDAVPERTPDGRILVLRLIGAREVDPL